MQTGMVAAQEQQLFWGVLAIQKSFYSQYKYSYWWLGRGVNKKKGVIETARIVLISWFLLD